MKLLMITSGRLPIPAVSGGAVETLIDLLLDYNEHHGKHEICTAAFYDSRAEEKSRSYQHTSFVYVKFGKLLSFVLKHHIVPYRWMDAVFSWKAIRQLKNRTETFDYIIIQNELVSGRVFRKHIKGSYLYHAHNDTLAEKYKKDIDFLRSCEKVITISDFLAVQFQKKADLKNTVTVYNGIDTELFQRSAHQERGAFLRKQYGISEEEMVIVFAGRLVPEKGADALLEAFMMLQEHINAKLLIIGASFFEESTDNAYIRKLKALCGRKKEHILFSGYVAYEEMPDYYSMADVGCVPSVWEEPFGLTVVEQMAMELPVVAAASGAIPEIVGAECGYVLERGEKLAQNTAAALTKLYDEKDRRERMGRAGRKMVCQKFSSQRFCENWFRTVEGECET